MTNVGAVGFSPELTDAVENYNETLVDQKRQADVVSGMLEQIVALCKEHDTGAAFMVAMMLLVQVEEKKGTKAAILSGVVGVANVLIRDYATKVTDSLSAITGGKSDTKTNKVFCDSLKELRAIASLPSNERPWLADDTAKGLVAAVDDVSAMFPNGLGNADAVAKAIKNWSEKPTEQNKDAAGKDIGTGTELMQKLTSKLASMSAGLSNFSGATSTQLSNAMAEIGQVHGADTNMFQSETAAINCFVNNQGKS